MVLGWSGVLFLMHVSKGGLIPSYYFMKRFAHFPLIQHSSKAFSIGRAMCEMGPTAKKPSRSDKSRKQGRTGGNKKRQHPLWQRVRLLMADLFLQHCSSSPAFPNWYTF